jgi:hypothetical protein
MDNEHHQRIKIWMGGLMLMVAVTIDLIQALLTLVAIGLVLSPLITIGATVLFWIWFKILGISFVSNPKRLVTFAAESIGELIPAIDALPLWTIGTLGTILITRSEDKGGLLGKAASLASPVLNQKRASVTPPALNSKVTSIESRRPLDLRKIEPTPIQKRETPKYIKDWSDATQRLNEHEHEKFVEKNYKGGMEKYNLDAKKHSSEWERQQENKRKLDKYFKNRNAA